MPEYPVSLAYSPLLGLIISGCAPLPSTSTAPDPATQQPVEVELLVNTLQCGEDIHEAGVQWITATAALDERYRWLNQLNSENQLSPPAVDFSAERILVVAMGPRPTSGYILNLPEQPPVSDGRVLDITVAWQEPEPDTQQAQVMVNPCLLLRFPALEVNRVRILDQAGSTKIEANGRVSDSG